MLKITKEGKSLIVQGEMNQHYPSNDTLTFPMNAIAMVIDSSDIVTFKSAANNDVIFSANINDITINGEAVDKSTIKDKFDAVSNAAQGGGGGTGGAVESVNGKTGDVVLTAGDLNAFNKQEIYGLLPNLDGYATEQWVMGQGYLNEIPDTYATDDEVSAAVADKVSQNALNEAIQGVVAQIPSVDNLATKDEVNNKQNKLTAGEGISIVDDTIKVTYKYDLFEIVTELPTENINDNKIYLKLSEKSGTNNKYIEYVHANGAWEKIGEYTADVNLDGYATEQWVGEQGYLKAVPEEYAKKTDIDTAVADKVSQNALNEAIQGVEGKIPVNISQLNNDSNFITSIPENYVTDEELELKDYATVSQLPDISGKQDTLVSGSTIKTINGTSLLGEGNIEIQGGGTVTVDDNLNLDSVNPVQNKVITAEMNKKVESLEITQQEYDELPVKDKNIMYIITDAPAVATEEWVTNKNYATVSQLPNIEGKLDTSVYNEDKKTFATKEELNSKANSSDITDMATMSWVGQQNYLKAVPENYVTDEELTAKDYATKSELNGKQDTLVNQVNIKSINGESLLGEGNIVVEGGGSQITVDEMLSTESLNPVQNKVITKELNKKVESVVMTQEEYDQLPEKDPNILYVISDAPAVAYKSDLEALATKEELNGKADASAIADMATMTWVTEQINAAIAGVNAKITEINNKIV